LLVQLGFRKRGARRENVRNGAAATGEKRRGRRKTEADSTLARRTSRRSSKSWLATFRRSATARRSQVSRFARPFLTLLTFLLSLAAVDGKSSGEAERSTATKQRRRR